MSNPSAHYRPEIDGLRAVAILLVSVFHFKLLPLGEAGFIGVDVFFVISGYLITGLLMRDLKAGTFSLGRFYLARLRRLMPALVATLALYLLAAYFVFLPARFAELSVEALLTQFYVINFYFWQTINYFGLRADGVPLLHMWSLAIEEQFYLFYPLLLLVLYRYARPALTIIIVGIVVCSFALGWWATGWKPEASFYLLPTRAWELGAGAILALLGSGAGQGARATRSLAGVVGAGLIVLAIALHTPVTPFPGWFAALPVVSAMLLIWAGPTSLSGRALSLRPMLWIGWISYPLYLVHWPVIQLMRVGLVEVTLWHRWAAFALSVLLAWGIWRWVEQPVRRGGMFQSAKHVLLAAGASTAALSVFALAGVLTDGFPHRVPPQARAILEYVDDTPDTFFACEYKADRPDAAPCALGQNDQPVRVAIIGDSHAQALAGALDLWLKDQGYAGALWFHHGCLPAAGAGNRDCRNFIDVATEKVATDPDITHVLLVSAWRHSPWIYDGAYIEDGPTADAALQAGLSQTVSKLSEPGRQVILVDPMFAAMARVPERLARNLTFGQNLPVDRPLDAHRAEFAALDAVFGKLAAETPELGRISLIEDLCSSGICQATLDGAPLFRDGTHIRFGVSKYFADRLAFAVALEKEVDE